MSTKGCRWVTQGSISRDWEFTLKKGSQTAKKVDYQPRLPSLLTPLTRPADLSPRGCHVETFDTPKHDSPPGYDSRAPPTHFLEEN